jgi:hypothetical protein
MGALEPLAPKTIVAASKPKWQAANAPDAVTGYAPVRARMQHHALPTAAALVAAPQHAKIAATERQES